MKHDCLKSDCHPDLTCSLGFMQREDCRLHFNFDELRKVVNDPQADPKRLEDIYMRLYPGEGLDQTYVLECLAQNPNAPLSVMRAFFYSRLYRKYVVTNPAFLLVPFCDDLSFATAAKNLLEKLAKDASHTGDGR